MRTALTWTGLAIAAGIAIQAGHIRTATAAGYDNNWCITDGLHGAGSLDCGYATFQQCLASRSGNGGTCVENPSLLWQRAGRSNARSSGRRSNQGRDY